MRNITLMTQIPSRYIHSICRSTILIALSLACFLSCEKDEGVFGDEIPDVNEPQRIARFDEVPRGPGETKLGRELTNPYSVEVMRKAADLLDGSQAVNTKAASVIQTTHYYLKVQPEGGQDFVDLMDFAEANEFNFEAQPVNYEVLYIGDDGYVDAKVSSNDIPPLYGTVTVKAYNSASFLRNMGVQILDRLYLDEDGYATPLTYTAYVISGNERDYEAIDGNCHPDCPNWPACLDEPVLTCDPEVPSSEISTLQPLEYGQVPDNFPSYILDDAMGQNGEFSLRICDDVIGGRPNCKDGCYAVLEEIAHEPGACRYVCRCPPVVDPPSDPNASTCGCSTSSDKRKPGGKMILVDTQLGEEGLRRVKVRSTRFRWGFLWKSTDTDDEGCWNIDRKYRVKRGKIQVVFKDRVSNRAVIRSFRGLRAWNAFLEAVDYTWYLTRDDNQWNNLCLKIEDDSDNTSLKEQTFVAATTSNGIHEFYDDHSSLASPGKTSFLIHTINQSLNAAPMYRRMDKQTISTSDITDWFSVYGIQYSGPLAIYWKVAKPDVFLSFGDNEKSDEKKNTVYHELAHVAQYHKLGILWWRQYVSAYIDVSLAGQRGESIYGTGSLPDAGRFEIAEGLANALADYMTGQQYGINHSQGGLFGTNVWAREAEKVTFHYLPTNYIPRGLFYDLLDSSTFPANVGSSAEATGVTDRVSGISFETQYNTLNPFVTDVASYKSSLLRRGGLGSSTADINTLFGSYGH